MMILRVLEPFGKAGTFFRIFRVGVENVLDIGFTVGKIECFDFGHSRKHADDGFVGIYIGHGMFGVGRVRMDTEFAVNEAFDAGLETMLETVFASGNPIIYGASSEVASGVD